MAFDDLIYFLWFTEHFEHYGPCVGCFAADIRPDFHYQKNSRGLKVILPPWGDNESVATEMLMHRLWRKGYSTLVYALPHYILCSDIHLTMKFFHIIRQRVMADIRRLRSEYGFSEIDIIGSSLGGVSACLVANGNDDVTGLYLIVPGNTLAGGLWDGIRTQGLRRVYEAQGVTRQALEQVWNGIAPQNNIDLLAGKKVFVGLSQADKVIPYRYGREFADLFLKSYPQTVVEENRRLGHYLTVIKYYLQSPVFFK